MSLNPEVPYVYNPAYHIKRGWRLQVIDTSLVTDFVAFRPGLTTTEQPNSDHVGTKVWIYITAAADLAIGVPVSRADDSAAYDACERNPAAGITARIIGVTAHAILNGESGWIVQKGVVNARVDGSYAQNESLISALAAGQLTAGTPAEVGIGIGLSAVGAGTESVYIDCK
jgi:hypothetical protein